MDLVLAGAGRRKPAAKPSLLDLATEVLVAQPGASLAAVAAAAGIGRTTLHKQYATRDALLRAVAHRALDRWELAVAGIEDGPDGGLRDLITALIPAGPALSFLWRTPEFDADEEITGRWIALEEATGAIVQRARDAGVVRSGVPSWWLVGTLYSVVYSAAEAVGHGRLAPVDAPGLALETLLHGIGP
jgi:AcrR family transcriptional regulator